MIPIFDATLYANKPADPLPGLRPIRAVYETELWDRGEDRSIVPDHDRLRAIALKCAGSLTWLNVEHWPITTAWLNDASRKTRRVNIRKLKEVIDVMHDAEPGLRVGYYGLLPPGLGRHMENERSWPDVIADYARLKYGRGEDGRFTAEGLADKVDVVFPSLYCRWEDEPEKWRKRAEKVIRMARGYQKQVFPFLWPQFHRSHVVSDMRNKYMGERWWRVMLETCDELADGAVIWGGYEGGVGHYPWNPDAAWWRVTRTWMGMPI